MIVILAFLLGLCCIAAGVGMIFFPAGIIAAGVGLVVLAAILSKGDRPDKP